MPKNVTARFFVASKDSSNPRYATIGMRPVTAKTGDENHPNTQFWNSTPSGVLQMTITNIAAAEFFEEGKEYDLTFAAVDPS